MRSRIARSAVVLLVVAAGAVYAIPYGAQPAYRNPVFANDAPDPAVIRADDDAYYAYTTQAYFNAQFVNTPILRSVDLVSWELVGDAERCALLREGPSAIASVMRTAHPVGSATSDDEFEPPLSRLAERPSGSLEAGCRDRGGSARR